MLGLALTQLLTSAGRLVQARSRVRAFWPSLAWTGTVLLILVQTWWAIFTFRDEPNWNFGEFALILAHPTLIFFLTVLVLPEADGDGTIDLRANYFAQRSWFFGAAAGVVVLSLLRPVIFDGHLPLDADRVVQFGFLLMTTAAALVRSPRLHHVLAIAAPMGILLYTVALFFRLP